MVWSETAYLLKMNAAAAPSDLITAVDNTVQQNLAAAESTIASKDAVWLHHSPLKILSIYSLTFDDGRADDT